MTKNRYLGILIAAVLSCCLTIAPANRAKAESPSEVLDLHTGVSVEVVLRLLGNPSKRVAGYEDTHGDAQRQLKEMGIETLVYRKMGIEVLARQGKVFSISVSAPFAGVFHGFKLATHFSEVQKARGNPDQTYFGPGASRKVYKTGETWTWGLGESQAGYYVSNVPEHVVVYDLDFETGIIRKISESDYRIRGRFFIFPTYK